MGSGAGKPVVSPAASTAYSFCYAGGTNGPSSGSSEAEPGPGGDGSRTPRGTGARNHHQQHQASGSSRPASQLSNYGEDVDEGCNMVCEACSASFTLFKRKYRCMDCDKFYCSNCFIKDPRKFCSTCSAILRNPTRDDLMTLKIKDLRLYLNTHSVSTLSCTEKKDLVDLILHYVQTHPQRPSRSNTTRSSTSTFSSSSSGRSSSVGQQGMRNGPGTTNGQGAQQRPANRFDEFVTDFVSRFANPGTESSVDPPTFNGRNSSGTQNDPFVSASATSTSTNIGSGQRPQSRQAWTPQQQTTSASTNTATTSTGDVPQTSQPESSQNSEQTPIQPIRRRASLSELEDADGIDSLTVKQLKEILTANFVDYKGCVERWELQERVRRLYDERQERKKKGETVLMIMSDNNNFVDYKGCVERWELQERVRRLYDERQERKKKGETVLMIMSDNNNFVDYKGCVERWELQERVRRLYDERQEWKKKGERVLMIMSDNNNFVDYKGCVERWELQERVRRLYDERQERKKKGETVLHVMIMSDNNNFVDYKGCVERWELQERVRRLYDERQERKKKEEKSRETTTEGMDLGEEEDNMCKICMDAPIDCVLLECGHMVTCTSCGKRMNECPICRQYVIRAVHIFRA